MTRIVPRAVEPRSHADVLAECVVAASVWHKGQYDKQGQPYILHPLRVMLSLPDDLKAVGVLHDVVEDCDVDESALKMQGLTEGQVAIIMAVSRRKGETYWDFVRRTRAAGAQAIAVKEADIADNTLPWRALPGMAERYARALRILRGQEA